MIATGSYSCSIREPPKARTSDVLVPHRDRAGSEVGMSAGQAAAVRALSPVTPAYLANGLTGTCTGIVC